MKTGVIDVGGGYKGVYASGVMDSCLENDVKFDFGIGISAGSANLLSYAAGQQGNNFKRYFRYKLRKKSGLANFITKHSYVDLDYIYTTLSASYGENPLDYEAARANPMELYFLVTDAKTGQAVYYPKQAVKKDDYTILKASCSIPFVCRCQKLGENFCYDGALADPVPIEKAFEMGCDKVVLILTSPRGRAKRSARDRFLARRIRKIYPACADKLMTLADRYNREVSIAEKYEKQGRALIISPDDTCGVDTIKSREKDLIRLYKKGREDGRQIAAFLGVPPRGKYLQKAQFCKMSASGK